LKKQIMAIKLKIKYYLPFDHLMGKTEIVEFERSAKLRDVLELLTKKYKGFAQSNTLDHIVILLNGKYCKIDWPVNDGDQISVLIPLVGG